MPIASRFEYDSLANPAEYPEASASTAVIYTNPVPALTQAYGSASQVDQFDVGTALARQALARVTWRPTPAQQQGLTAQLEAAIQAACRTLLGEEASASELDELGGMVVSTVRECCFGKLPHED
jgi:hypothetical protein